MKHLCLGREAYDLMRRIYATSRRLDYVRHEKGLPVVEELIRQALGRLWKKADDLGITEDDLSSIAEKLWIDASSDDVSFDYRDSCIIHLRHVQRVSEGNGDCTLSCPYAANRECSPFCGFYCPATDRQVENFETGRDIYD